MDNMTDQDEVYTPEQSLAQKVLSLALLAIFLIIVIIEVCTAGQ